MGGLSGSEWVFGYASLVADAAAGGAVEAELMGFRRALGVAHDNRRIIPGYKTYLRRDDGTRPDVYVAFFDLEVADGMRWRAWRCPSTTTAGPPWTRARPTTSART